MFFRLQGQPSLLRQEVRALPPSDLPVIIDEVQALIDEDLAAYCGTYLREEIQAEALVRRLDGFSRFLQVAGLASATELNFEALARDCGVPARTVREYVAILVDTLLATTLEPWRAGGKRKPVSHAKLYFFDLGVARTLARRGPPRPESAEWGWALESLVFQELRAWCAHHGERVVACQERVAHLTDDGVLVLPVLEFLSRLWAGEWA